MESEKGNKDDFYAVVSALARFIETADADLAHASTEHSALQSNTENIS